MPVDKHGSVKVLPYHLYFNFATTKATVNIFAEILYAGRAAIDMKHIKRDFSLKASRSEAPRPKSFFFQNMVMLHINLKLTTLAATW